MYFWRIDALKDELAQSHLAQLDALKYYVVAGAVTILLYGLAPAEQDFWDVLGILGDSVLLMAGGLSLLSRK